MSPYRIRLHRKLLTLTAAGESFHFKFDFFHFIIDKKLNFRGNRSFAENVQMFEYFAAFRREKIPPTTLAKGLCYNTLLICNVLTVKAWQF